VTHSGEGHIGGGDGSDCPACTKYGPWIESEAFPGDRWREVYGPFACANDAPTDDPPGPEHYCDECGDCMACDGGDEGWDGHPHRAVEYQYGDDE
jgi:hypothetical protein